MFEPKPPQLLPLPRFIGRMARILLLALSIVTIALLIGYLAIIPLRTCPGLIRY